VTPTALMSGAVAAMLLSRYAVPVHGRAADLHRRASSRAVETAEHSPAANAPAENAA